MLLRRMLLAVLTAGCASQMTLAQEMTWDAYKACLPQGPSTRLDQVWPDGRWHVSGRETEVHKVSNCMSKHWREAKPQNQPSDPGPTSGRSVLGIPSTASPSAPAWQPGDAWAFREESPRRSGTFVWSVERDEYVGGERHYVMRSSASREIYYRAEDLAYVMEKVNGAVESRAVPADIRYDWPLAVGKRWRWKYVQDSVKDRTKEDRERECEVVKQETLTVTAGTFETFKIACRNSRSGQLTHEAWYAPAVKHWVRWYGYWSYGRQERELIGFKLK